MLDRISQKSVLIFLLCSSLAGCGPAPENYRQEIVLEVILAAERNNLVKLAAMTKGAKLTPNVTQDQVKDLLFIKNDFQYCALANLFGGETNNTVVQARWDCNTVQDHVVNFTFNGDRISEIEAIPQE